MRIAAPAVLALALALTAGCSSEPVPTIAAGPPPTTAAAPTTDSTFGDQTLSPRGNRVKAIGQPGAVLNPGVTDPVLEFRVDGIRQNADCEADGYTDNPENGQFLAVDVYARTTPEYNPTTNDTEFLGAGYSWSVVTADGVRHNVDTGPAFGCSPSSRRNLSGLTPGITVSGTLLLDAPTDLAGAVVTVTAFGTPGGWEWAVPVA